ncbi:MAG: hypothetical protein AAGE52_24100 [Myxococcota bacterium]
MRWSIPLSVLAIVSCQQPAERPLAPPSDGVFSFANGCFTLDAAAPGSRRSRWLASAPESYAFTAENPSEGARLHLRAAALGVYLLYDAEGFFVVGEENGLARRNELESDLTLLDDSFISPAEWSLEVSPQDETRFRLHHVQTNLYLGADASLVEEEEAAVVTFYPASGCREFPELTVDAEGVVDGATWDDGDVYGFAEVHTHLFTNFGFGGAGMFHGSPYHRLGVEHALPSCEQFHGLEGRRDIIGFAFSGLGDIDVDSLTGVFLTGRTPEANHRTDGYPTFTDWPNSWNSSTHQMQYYRWIERAYLGGLRLMVQHATSNSVLCELLAGVRAQPTRYSCNDMVAIDREIEETYALERYIDAQSGGPGQGWFRVVTSPAEAREVIRQGRLAVVLGIETSNLFDCFLTPREGFPNCTDESIRAKLDEYHDRGVRVLFPVHKFDNAFSAGDGDRNVGQIGSFVNSGHYSNFVTDCPLSHAHFDKGNVLFGGLNMPRPNYLSPPQNDMSGFRESPVGALAPFLDALSAPALEGDYCQASGLTALGETLVREMMLRGMILEVDHLPRRAYERAFELLVENDYPAAGTHGTTNGGVIHQLGGVSKADFRRCGEPGVPGHMGERYTRRIDQIREVGGFPAEGFGFDLNGFAGGPRPRFGDRSPCLAPQANPITYPFTSYRGDVTFTQPHLGERIVDFNTEGMLHIGLIPELIEDARRDGMTDEDLEPLFRSAEAYLRMWERAEERADALRR